ncbi:MAG: hypothetical protein Q9202_007308 [Teloschistes flavicans]
MGNKQDPDALEKLKAEFAQHKKLPFLEYLQGCHRALHTPIRIEENPTLTTHGRLAKPKNRWRPDRLAHWDDFSQHSKAILDSAKLHLQPTESQPHLFKSLETLKELREMFCSTTLKNEADVRRYEYAAVEAHVAAIIQALAQITQAKRELNLADGITFENEPTAFGEEQRTTPRNSDDESEESDFGEEKDRTKADQYQIRSAGAKKELKLVVEYKAGHKLTSTTVRYGFRPMDIDQVLNRKDIPPEAISNGKSSRKRKRLVREIELEAEKERFQYDSDCLASAVAIQTFHYMIASGLSYSYITTGVAFIFLYINYDDPTTLYYQVSIPDQKEKDDQLDPYSTAVGQVLSLTLLAMKTDQQRQVVRKAARSKLQKTSCYTFNSVLLGSPLTTTHSQSAMEEYKEDAPPHKKKRKDDDSDEAPSPTPRITRASSKKQRAPTSMTTKADGEKNYGNNREGGQKVTQKQYCTQKCLLGLMQGQPLDANCPNVTHHNRDGSNHLIAATEFPNLLRDQLTKDLDHDCEPLGLYGARGYLFRVTLASHGYVFVAKGSTRSSYLRHEGKIYEHLKTLQGKAIPVHLGNINLIDRYYLDWHPIKHFLLLAWGGEHAGYCAELGSYNDPRIEREVKRTWSQVWRGNVDQGDYRGPNFLWNAELNRVMLVDFERAVLRVNPMQKQPVSEKSRSLPRDTHTREPSLKRKASAIDLVDSKYTKTDMSLPQRRSDDGLVK